MREVSLLAIDLAKSVFQLHGVDRNGKAILRKKLSRAKLPEFIVNFPRCLIVMEACGGSHHWARTFQEMGHDVKLISPQFVKPFVKTNKNDANDAEAIAEAAVRPSMRFVPVKTKNQQDVLCLHRIRERIISSRTALTNEARGLLMEYGIAIPKGLSKLRAAFPVILENADEALTPEARTMFDKLYEKIVDCNEKIKYYDDKIQSLAKASAPCQKIMKIPGVGPVTATAIVAAMGDASSFSGGREVSAWLGLVPRQNSSGGKQNLGGISKRGDVYLRKLLIHSARAVVKGIDDQAPSTRIEWLQKLVARRGFNRTCVALANKNARVIWRLLATEDEYRAAV